MTGSSSAPSRPRPRSRPRPGTTRGLGVDDAFLTEIAREASTTRWRVHSVFRRTVNIVSTHEVMLTLACSGSTSAPSTLVCSAARLDDLGLQPGAGVCWATDGLTLGDAVTISMRGAVTTSSVVLARPVGAEALRDGVTALDERLRACGRKGSFFPDETVSPFAHELHRRLEAGRSVARRRRHGWARQDSEELCASLLGLGVGLTPSGDDYLVGFLTAHLANEGTASRVGELARVAAETAPSMTNAISAAAVLAASRGRARQELSVVVHAALDGDAARLGTSLEALLALGSTSGTDMTVGVLDALHTMLDLKEC